jgi:hypothetical protein
MPHVERWIPENEMRPGLAPNICATNLIFEQSGRGGACNKRQTSLAKRLYRLEQ